jgi:hypothetical protein
MMTGQIFSYSGSYIEGSTVTVDVSGITDVDGSFETASIWQVLEVSGGSWSDISGETYTSFTISDTQFYVDKYLRVKITTTDGYGGSSDFLSTPTQVVNVNDDPVADDIVTSITVNENSIEETINITPGLFTDVDGDSLIVTLADASYGSVNVIGAYTLTYTPNANFNGEDTIIYTVSDGQGGTVTGIVTVIVVSTNNPPSDLHLSNNTIPSNNYGAVIGSFLMDDEDVYDKYTRYKFTIINIINNDIDITDNSIFEINDGNILKLKDDIYISYNTTSPILNNYIVKINGTDIGTNEYSTNTTIIKTFDISVILSGDTYYNISSEPQAFFNSITLTGNHIIKSNNTDNTIGTLINNIKHVDKNNYVYLYELSGPHSDKLEIKNNELKVKDGIFFNINDIQVIQNLVIKTYTLNVPQNISVVKYSSTFNIIIKKINIIPDNIKLNLNPNYRNNSNTMYGDVREAIIGTLESESSNINNTNSYKVVGYSYY